ncbi:MAG: hypothetical protein WCW26_00585 [Candidatus Buchananbacteria bacterium]
MLKNKFGILTVILSLIIVVGIGLFFYNQYTIFGRKTSEQNYIKEISTLKIVDPEGLGKDQEKFKSNFNQQAQGFLADNGKTSASYWPLISLGALKQQVGDYAGAEQAWLLAAQLQPKAYPPYGNLGYLYFHYLKDYARAETAFLKALENDPAQIQYYAELRQLYQYFYKKDQNLAETIVLKGLENNKDNLGLLEELVTYYKDTNNFDKAIQTCQRVLKINPKDQFAIQTLKELQP